MRIFDEDDLPVPVGDHFDGLADALRLADKHGINAAFVVITALQQLAGETNLSSRDVVIHVTGAARAMVNQKVEVELSEEMAREYISKFAGYIETLPLTIQNDMRRDLTAKFRELLQK